MVFPAHQTTAGLLLLAELPAGELAALYAEEGERRRLRTELARIRKAGFVVNHGRSEKGVVAVGVPVRDGGVAVAGLSVSMPGVRYDRHACRPWSGPSRPPLARWKPTCIRSRPRERQHQARGVRGVAVDLVGDGPTHRQVEGVRRQQPVVGVGERLVVRELHDEAVTGPEATCRCCRASGRRLSLVPRGSPVGGCRRKSAKPQVSGLVAVRVESASAAVGHRFRGFVHHFRASLWPHHWQPSGSRSEQVGEQVRAGEQRARRWSRRPF